MSLANHLHQQRGSKVNFYLLGPEAAGQLGNACVHGDLGERPVKILVTDFEFQFWPHDDLLCGFYTYACTPQLAEALKGSNLTGFELDKLNVSFEERFHQWAELHKEEALPEYQWLKITGRAGVDDFGLINGPCPLPLVVSGRAFGILNQFKLEYCDIENYTRQKLSAAG